MVERVISPAFTKSDGWRMVRYRLGRIKKKKRETICEVEKVIVMAVAMNGKLPMINYVPGAPMISL